MSSFQGLFAGKRLRYESHRQTASTKVRNGTIPVAHLGVLPKTPGN
jgi:hypothetical protein